LSTSSRERLLLAMQDLMQQQGYAATGLSQILAHAAAPKGVLYHHFPGGKRALAEAAVAAAGERVLASFEVLFARTPDPLEALMAWTQSVAGALKKSQYARGCPLATIALEAAASEDELQIVLAAAFAAMQARIAKQFELAGASPEGAQSHANLVLSTYEGGLLLARAQRSTAPFVDAMTTLHHLLQTAQRARP